MSYLRVDHVAEIQGLEGPMAFPELLLQKIWFRGELARGGLTMRDGRRLEILQRGRWNRQGGPDFRNCHLRIGDSEYVGDVELHLNAEDWDTHGHASDPTYSEVVLHAVLFPPAENYRTLAYDGREIPLLVLLPFLPYDLESFAWDDAAERLARRSLFHVHEHLGLLTPADLGKLLRRQAQARWLQKLSFSRLMIERLGWESACHHAALDCLGHRFNRAPMLKVAARWPLLEWDTQSLTAEHIHQTMAEFWRPQAGRPANHPLHRLRQYRAWTQAVPRWPEKLHAFALELPDLTQPGTTEELRKRGSLPRLRRRLAEEICGSSLSSPRLDTFFIDACLPLCACLHPGSLFSLWFNWYLGDAPHPYIKSLQELEVLSPKTQLICNGLIQGLLSWCAAQEAKGFT